MRAREDPAVAVARVFAECVAVRVGLVIGAWPPPRSHPGGAVPALRHLAGTALGRSRYLLEGPT
jgi:hypothetical protein